MRKGSAYNQNRLRKYRIKNFNVNIEKYNKLKLLPKFNLIIDCCAEPAIEASKSDPARVFNTNLVGTFNILNKCIKDNSNIIFLSSSRVYSIEKLRNLIKNLNLKKPININKKIDEKFSTHSASSLYGFTKLASEKLIREFFYKTKLKYIINRFGVIAGPCQFGKQDQGFVSLWVAKHFFKKNLSYIGFGGHGNQVRDVIHIKDVCEIIYIQIQKFRTINNEIFNIGGGVKNALSLKDLTKKCEKLTKNQINFKKIYKTSNFDIPYYVTDNSKINRFYKWKPAHSIDRLINDIYKWLDKNHKLKKYFL